MKLYLAMIMLTLCTLTKPAFADQDKDLRIEQLQQQVSQLKHKLHQLKQQSNNTTERQRNDININSARTQWGCYLDDINAGGIYGTGSTEAEAKGKTLAKCQQKKGACFEMNLKCSQDK